MKISSMMLIAAGVLLAATIQARTFFVAPNGSDGNTGSQQSPWKTFDFAQPQLLPNDTLYFLEGIYTDPLTITCSGDGTGPVTIAAFPGQTAEFKNSSYASTAITVLGMRLVIAGFHIDHWSNAIDITAPAHDVVVSKCLVFDVGFGIALYDGVHDITLRDCEMHHFGWFGFDCTAGGATNDIHNVLVQHCWSHDPDFTLPIANGDGNADGFACGHNNEYDITFLDCHAENTGDGFDLDGRRVVAMNCTANGTTYGGGGGFKCWGDSVVLVNCLSYGHVNSGIELDQETDPGAQYRDKPTRTFIINCTIANCGLAGLQIYDTLKRFTMYNTLFAGGPVGAGADTASAKGMLWEIAPATGAPTNYTGDYNLFHSINTWRYIDAVTATYGVFADQSLPLSAWQAASGQDAHSKFLTSSDGLFVDMARNDFHLAVGSAAIGAASSAYAPSADKDGRPRKNTPDAGCYEYALTAIDDAPVPGHDAAALYPNPTHDRITIPLAPDEHAVVLVVDILGRVVRAVRSSNESLLTISLQDLPRGMYVCLVHSGVRSERLAVELK